jgi:hypothetical protein
VGREVIHLKPGLDGVDGVQSRLHHDAGGPSGYDALCEQIKQYTESVPIVG